MTVKQKINIINYNRRIVCTSLIFEFYPYTKSVVFGE